MAFDFFKFFRRNHPQKISKTALCYNADGTINWDDENTKNTLFSMGAENQTLENYVFLYDVHRLRKQLVTPNETIHTLATLLYYKHIAVESELKPYRVLVNNEQQTLSIRINIPDTLAQQFHQLMPAINTATSSDIMHLFEEAVIDVLEMLPVLKRKRQISQSSVKDGHIFVTSNNALTKTTDDTINWADDNTKNSLFKKGFEEDNLGYYVFLYDCYCLRKLFNENKQDPKIYALAMTLYYKHLVRNPQLLTEYWVVVNNRREHLKNNVRLSSDLINQFEAMNTDITNITPAQIIALYDKAVIQTINRLKSPNRLRELSDSVSSSSRFL